MFKVNPIGFLMTPYSFHTPSRPSNKDGDFYLRINQEFVQGLEELDSFNYIYIITYLHKTDHKINLMVSPPFVPDNRKVGLFASRSPHRPNPLGLHIVKLNKIEDDKLFIFAIDCLNNTPVLDIKPYINKNDNIDEANSGWINQEGDFNIKLYTDGSCYGNPGPGGYAALIMNQDDSIEITGFQPDTTNNRMEIMAVLEGLKRIKYGSKVKVFSDSSYVIKGATEWLNSWKNKGWKTSSNKAVKNKDLWIELDKLLLRYELEFIKVKGHSGNKYNERVDSMAREEIEKNMDQI